MQIEHIHYLVRVFLAFRAEFYFPAHGGHKKLIVGILIHHAHLSEPAAAGAAFTQFFIYELFRLSAVSLFKTRDYTHERSLSATVLSENKQSFPLVNSEVDAR